MKIDVRVMLEDEEGQVFMGIGVIWLLKGIEEHRSISQAARDMELSYPKALRMLQNLEAGIRQPAVLRHKGGSQRGGAELTEAGREFLARYDRVQAAIKRFATEQFEQHLEGLFVAPPPDGGRAGPAAAKTSAPRGARPRDDRP